MKVSINVTDVRMVQQSVHYYTDPKREEYERVAITDMSADASVVANLLRAIAENISPTSGLGSDFGENLRRTAGLAAARVSS